MIRPADASVGPLSELLESFADGTVEIVDLTNRLSAQTPSLTLPHPYPSPAAFRIDELASYDARGPDWKHHDIRMGEHVGTHVDAPIHWKSGRDGADVSELPLRRLVGQAAVLDVSAEVASHPDFVVEVSHVRAWEERYGRLPANGWLLVRTGWGVFSQDAERFRNRDHDGGHTPGFSPECARWLAEETDLSGVGVETMGIDAGQAHRMEPPRPMHHHLLGNDKYGVTSLQNLSALPAVGAVIIVAPLPIVGGTGSPARVMALVPR